MVLVAPDVVRYTCNGTYLGRPTANVLDVEIQSTGGATERGLAIRDLATRMAFAWEADLLPLLHESFTLDSISWVDLDSESGSVGSTTVIFPGVGFLPQPGEISGQPYSANTACLIQKDVVASRGQRQGRWFLAGLAEQYVNGNDLETTFTGPLQTAFEEFQDRLVNLDGLDYISFPVVVHTSTDRSSIPATVTYEGKSPIVGWSVQGRVASQRRRNRP